MIGGGEKITQLRQGEKKNQLKRGEKRRLYKGKTQESAVLHMIIREEGKADAKALMTERTALEEMMVTEDVRETMIGGETVTNGVITKIIESVRETTIEDETEMMVVSEIEKKVIDMIEKIDILMREDQEKELLLFHQRTRQLKFYARRKSG